MGSSNRHWPSMFKSKPSSAHHEFTSPHFSSSPPCKSGVEERTPEPKPRWNPKPEQIRILEAIFNSGMVNPPREEIKKIRGQLQEYGQVGDANVFYWFQNRKSRSKQKNRHKNPAVSAAAAAIPPQTPPLAPVLPSSSSSSSSDRSSPNAAPKVVGPVLESPTTYNNNFTNGQEVLPFFYPGGFGPSYNELTAPPAGSGGVFSDYSSEVVHPVGPEHNFSGILMGGDRAFEEEMSFNSPTVFSSFTQLQGAGEACVGGRIMGIGPTRSTVFINDVSFEVPALGPFNLREVFGEDVVLLHQSGHPVPTNEWGVTLHPLQHGAFYYLARTSPPPPHTMAFSLLSNSLSNFN